MDSSGEKFKARPTTRGGNVQLADLCDYFSHLGVMSTMNRTIYYLVYNESNKL